MQEGKRGSVVGAKSAMLVFSEGCAGDRLRVAGQSDEVAAAALVALAHSLSPDSGIVENIGAPYEFEAPFWAGERPVGPVPWWGEDQPPYPLTFHPLELGEEALRAFAGFVLEGRLHPNDVDAHAFPLNGFRVTDPNGPDPARARTELEQRVAAMRLRGHTTVQFGASAVKTVLDRVRRTSEGRRL